MAAVTAEVPHMPLEHLIHGHVPGVCVLLENVPHGSFFAVPINEDQFVNSQPGNTFILDSRITFAWDYLLAQGVEYLKRLMEPVGPYGSLAFQEANLEIHVLPDHWLPYISDNMIPHYLQPLTVPEPMNIALYNAHRAWDQLLGLYAFISLLRHKTLGKNLTIRCPKDSVDWRYHALYCHAGVRPRLDSTQLFDEEGNHADPAMQESARLARHQMQIIDKLCKRHQEDKDVMEDLANQFAELSLHNSVLRRELTEVTGQQSVLGIELGRSKEALKRTLKRVHNAEDYIVALQEDSFGNFTKVPYTDHHSSGHPSPPSSGSTSSTDYSSVDPPPTPYICSMKVFEEED